MTPNDSPSGDPESPPAASGTGGRYVAYETDDGTFVIRDESEPDAWIRSDRAVDLAADVS